MALAGLGSSGKCPDEVMKSSTVAMHALNLSGTTVEIQTRILEEAKAEAEAETRIQIDYST